MIRIIVEIDENRNVFIDGKKIPKTESKPTRSIEKEITQPVKKGEHPIYAERRCPTCGESFVPNGPRQKYCSEKCGLRPKSEKERLKQKRKQLSVEKRTRISTSPKVTPYPRPAIKSFSEITGGGIDEDKDHYPTAEQIKRSKDHPYDL